MVAPGTIGITASRTAKPRPSSASLACTPPPASRPKAEPPESAMASMRSTVLSRCSSASSRVPGPPPRTSIADRRPIENHRRHAGRKGGVMGVTDANAGKSVRRFFIGCFLQGREMTAGPRCGQPGGKALDAAQTERKRPGRPGRWRRGRDRMNGYEPFGLISV